LSTRFNRPKRPDPNLRLTAEGTRVVVLKENGGLAPGIISQVRLEPHLRTYVVTCDDGQVVFASAYDLALEEDSSRTPLGLRPET
jgi:hypothetical protein